MKVRTTIRPDQTLEVGDVEYRSLQRLGLVLETVEPYDTATVPPSKLSTGILRAHDSQED